MCGAEFTREQREAIFALERELVEASRAEDNVPSGTELERNYKEMLTALGEVLLLAKGSSPSGKLSILGQRYKEDAERLANGVEASREYSSWMESGLRNLGMYLNGRSS